MHNNMQSESAAINFLTSLDAEQKNAIDAIASRLRYRKKEYIFQANATNDSIYILLDGRVKLFRLAPSGHECIQWFCFPGDIFGISENTHQYINGLYAQSTAEAEVYAIPKNEFNRLVTDMPSLALVVMEQLTLRVRTLGDMLLHVTCDDAYARLISLLQRLGAMYGKPCHDEVILDLHLTHQDIADMIGVCRQTVSSMIAKLKRQGIIKCDRRTIAIKQRLVKENPMHTRPRTYRPEKHIA